MVNAFVRQIALGKIAVMMVAAGVAEVAVDHARNALMEHVKMKLMELFVRLVHAVDSFGINLKHVLMVHVQAAAGRKIVMIQMYAQMILAVLQMAVQVLIIRYRAMMGIRVQDLINVVMEHAKAL